MRSGDLTNAHDRCNASGLHSTLRGLDLNASLQRTESSTDVNVSVASGEGGSRARAPASLGSSLCLWKQEGSFKPSNAG